MKKKSRVKRDTKIILKIIGFEEYSCEFPNDEILDYLNLSWDDILGAEIGMIDMPGYFYKEDNAHLGKIIVGGGSLEVSLATVKGNFSLQPFLRYDKRHKIGLKEEHFNPKLRIVFPDGKDITLPEPGTKYNIFGENMKEVLKIKTNIHIWNAYGPETGTRYSGKIMRKFKKKPPKTKRVVKK